MKKKTFKKSIVAVCACSAMLLAGATSVSAYWTYDTTTLPRTESYVLGTSRQGYQCKFSGQNDSTSARNVEFGYYVKDSRDRVTTIYKKSIGKGQNAEVKQTDHFPDSHIFYVDMDVFAAYTGCYATAETCVNSEPKNN